MKKIDNLCGEAYNNAIYSVMDLLNTTFGMDLFYARDWSKIDELANKLGINFDENGYILK